MSRRNKNIGDWGEERAREFLCRNGFAIVESNFFTTFGEIDLVAKKGGDYYFVEVKTRFENSLANDLSITYSKKKKLEKAMRIYCFRRDIKNVSLILAGLVVSVDERLKKAKLRFVVLR